MIDESTFVKSGSELRRTSVECCLSNSLPTDINHFAEDRHVAPLEVFVVLIRRPRCVAELRNYHRVGLGQIAEFANDWDGYTGRWLLGRRTAEGLPVAPKSKVGQRHQLIPLTVKSRNRTQAEFFEELSLRCRFRPSPSD